jgi:hypothetical protein
MPAMPPEDVSHRDIYVRLADLGAKIDSILTIMADRKEDITKLTADLNNLYARQRTLETQMARVLVIGAALALLVPAFATMIQLKLSTPTAVERLEAR